MEPLIKQKLNSYELSRKWFDWCFENPEKVTPNHTALYFFAIEHCNRLGWKEKFGFPMQMAKDAIGIKNYRTYTKAFEDLIEWGFFEMHQKSKNQYSANIIAIAKNTQATTKALSIAMQKHSQKQVHGIVGIDKQIQNNTEPMNKDYLDISYFKRLGHDFNLEAKTEISMNEFLEYRANRKEKIQDHKVIEKIILEMFGKSTNQADWIRMIDFTIARGAKHIITDVPQNVKPVAKVKKPSWFSYYHEYLAYCEKEGITPEPQIAA